jgi:hypothetical protein
MRRLGATMTVSEFGEVQMPPTYSANTCHGRSWMAHLKLVPYDMELTYGSPSGQMAFPDEIEEAIAG